MTNLEIYQLLRDQFRTSDDNLDQLAAACTTHDQTVQLNAEWTQAEANYVAARNKIFAEDDPGVDSIGKQLQTAQDSIEADLASLQNVAETLDKISDAVHLGTTLLSMAMVVA
jgi:hypothetical protein